MDEVLLKRLSPSLHFPCLYLVATSQLKVHLFRLS
ncbi:unnamed protein product [Tenebrio molitor]|nr:unnamed protein product [Tenebrio molitor]